MRGIAATDEIDYLRFIADLPPIYELVFSRKPGAAPPTFFFIRCQGSNYVVREATAPGRVRGAVSQMGFEDACAGHCDGDFWTLALHQGRGIYTHGPRASLPENNVAHTVEALWNFCTEPLRLGLPAGDFRTLFCKGDTFVLPIGSSGQRYDGRIHRSDAGQITALEFGIVPDKLARRWFIKYEYEPTPMILKGFPSAYDLSMRMGQTPERHLQSTRILSLVLATNPMPHATFQAQWLLDTPELQENLMSNNVFYVKRSNAWEKVDLARYRDFGSATNSSLFKISSWLFKISAAFVVLVAGWIAVQLARRTR